MGKQLPHRPEGLALSTCFTRCQRGMQQRSTCVQEAAHMLMPGMLLCGAARWQRDRAAPAAAILPDAAAAQEGRRQGATTARRRCHHST